MLLKKIMPFGYDYLAKHRFCVILFFTNKEFIIQPLVCIVKGLNFA